MDTPSTRITLLALLRAEPTDQNAWSEFVARYGPKVAEWCRAQRLAPSQVEELTQDVLINLFQAFRTFQYDAQKGQFRAYLYTVTRRTISAWQKRVMRAPKTSMDEVLSLVPAEDDLFRRLDAEFDLERLHLAMRQEQSRVQSATWKAFQTTELEGQKAAVVGAELGLSVATVNVYRSRVRALIKEELKCLDDKPVSQDF